MTRKSKVDFPSLFAMQDSLSKMVFVVRLISMPDGEYQQWLGIIEKMRKVVKEKKSNGA